MCEGIGGQEMEELVPEWGLGLRRDKGSWFQRQGEAQRKERSVIFRDDDEGGWHDDPDRFSGDWSNLEGSSLLEAVCLKQLQAVDHPELLSDRYLDSVK